LGFQPEKWKANYGAAKWQLISIQRQGLGCFAIDASSSP